MTVKINTSYFRQRDVDVVAIAYRIVDSLTNNPQFPNPTPALADVQLALNDYQAALSDAGNRDRAMVSVKNDKKLALCNLLQELAEYVTATANGDKSILLTSGFILAKEKGESLLNAKAVIDVDIRIPGQATILANKVPGAKAYAHQYTRDAVITPDSVWVSETTVNRRHTFTNLPTAVKFWFRSIAVGANGVSVYSEAVTRVIQ